MTAVNRANIFDIKRFGIHDGVGIRTVFFIKGCPLRCHWCQNPEGFLQSIRIWCMRRSCLRCKNCIEVCPEKILNFDEQGVKTSEDCKRCGACVSICPAGALRFDAKTMNVAEALTEIEKDRVFYEISGGGVTLSGGECTMSSQFSLELLTACRELGIGTAIETCLYTHPEVMHLFHLVSDRIIADIKLADPSAHRAATGVDNKLILENLRMLTETDCDLLIRIPLIPGFTATEKNIREIGVLIAGLPRRVPVEVVHFNPMCREKYEMLDIDYPVKQLIPLDKTQINMYKELLTSYGLQVL